MDTVRSMGADRLATAVLDALPDATAVLDPTGEIVAVNRTWRMFAVDNGGSPSTTGVGVSYLELCARSAAAGCEDADVAASGLRAVLSGETVQHEQEYPCPSPTVDRWFLLRITPLSGSTSGAVASHVNITRRKMAEQSLAHEAAHDPLTGLANRTLFNARLDAALTPRLGRSATSDIGVLYIDLDQFKSINDTYGHDAGDEVLLTCAHRLRTQVRPGDTVARLGGDEFAVVAPRVTTKDLTALVGRISQALLEPHHVYGRTLRIQASVGDYLASSGELTLDVMRHADEAMYAIKRGHASAEV
jgi:diguanylate cyclase (GGDEF)-like protein